MGRELISLLAILNLPLVMQGSNHGEVDVPNRHRPFGTILVLDIKEGKIQVLLGRLWDCSQSTLPRLTNDAA